MGSAAEERADDLTIEKDVGQGLPPILDDDSFGNGNGSNGGDSDRPIKSAVLAMLLFLGAEVMFFAGLIGAFIVLRFGASDWPPPGQPRLPVVVTGINTAILLFSGLTMFKTKRLLKDWHREKILQGLTITVLLGALFLAVQGFEWTRLLGFGFTLSSNIYGTVFYTLIGCHALHVLGAVIWLTIVVSRLRMNPPAYNANNHVGIKLSGMYWYLVVALWPVLYGLVYFN